MSYILEIDRRGSMNKAAQGLFISQSALSNAVSEVEKELGITVFRRSNRGIALTEEGRELVKQIAPIVEQSHKLSRYYSRRKDAERVQLSVAAQHYPFCDSAFVAFFRSLGNRPLQLSLKETDMASVIASVASGASDLGVIFVSDLTEHTIFGSLEEKNLVFRPLLTLRPHVFMRRGHPLASEKELTLEQLRACPHVVFTQSDSRLDYAEEAVVCSGVDYEQIVCVSDRATIYNVMAHTDCVSTGSGLLPAGFSDERLIAIPLADGRDMRLGTIHQRQHAFTAAEKAFMELLKDSAME